MLKLLLWCRDIPMRGRKTKHEVAGGPEELVAESGTDTCNEMNRVFMVLCQIAGFASRYVGHFATFASFFGTPVPRSDPGDFRGLIRDRRMDATDWSGRMDSPQSRKERKVIGDHCFLRDLGALAVNSRHARVVT